MPMHAPTERAQVARLERVWAEHAAEVALQLPSIDPSLGTTVRSLADGLLVLQGPGMYVNRALALGLTGPVDARVFEELADLSARMGLPPAIDVTPHTDASVIAGALTRGFVAGAEVTVMTMALDDAAPAALADDRSIVVTAIADHEVPVWQQVSEDAWEIDTDMGRRASRNFVAAVHGVAAEQLMLARDAHDGRPLGCATVIIRDGIASLGGMSTLPAERRRGVQQALVRARLETGLAAGCEFAAVSAMSGGASARNLVRLGFVPAYVKATHTSPMAAPIGT